VGARVVGPSIRGMGIEKLGLWCGGGQGLSIGYA
jgi:hypothetical protein